MATWLSSLWNFKLLASMGKLGCDKSRVKKVLTCKIHIDKLEVELRGRISRSD